MFHDDDDGDSDDDNDDDDGDSDDDNDDDDDTNCDDGNDSRSYEKFSDQFSEKLFSYFYVVPHLLTFCSIRWLLL